MGRADYYAEGDWNATCGFCGRKRKASELEKNWQGLMVCPEHNPPRQPQDFVRGIADNSSAPWSQPMPEDVFNLNILLTEAATDETSEFFIMTEDSQPITTES